MLVKWFSCFHVSVSTRRWQRGSDRGHLLSHCLSLSLSLCDTSYCSASVSITDIWQYSSCRVSKCNIHWSDDLTDNFTVYHSWRGYSHIFYTTDRERIFYTQDLKSDCGFDDECIFLKVRLWQFWNAWSTSVNPRDIFSHISPEKFLVIFLLSLNSWHLLTVVTGAGTQHCTAQQTRAENDISAQSENNWHGKMPPAKLAAVWWTTTSTRILFLDMKRDTPLLLP